MAIEIKSGIGTPLLAVDAYANSLRNSPASRGPSYSISGVTGTIAAAASANSCFFAMRNSPTSNRNVLVVSVTLDYTAIAAYTTPVTAGRRLSLFRGAGAASSGGTALTTFRHLSTSPVPSTDTSQGGDARIASTSGLTVTGITFEAMEMASLQLASFGNAGATIRAIFEFGFSGDEPIILRPGELLAVRNPVAMDAGGTWQLGVVVKFTEA